jgi:hypothetical protein
MRTKLGRLDGQRVGLDDEWAKCLLRLWIYSYPVTQIVTYSVDGIYDTLHCPMNVCKNLVCTKSSEQPRYVRRQCINMLLVSNHLESRKASVKVVWIQNMPQIIFHSYVWSNLVLTVKCLRSSSRDAHMTARLQVEHHLLVSHLTPTQAWK